MVDFIDYTCTAAVESLRQSLLLRGPNRSAGWQRFRAALNRSKAPVPTTSSVSEPSERPLPVAMMVTEGLTVQALLKVLQCKTVQLSAASLAHLAATSSLFRAALYDGPETRAHVMLNPWCRTPNTLPPRRARRACTPVATVGSDSSS